jgi:ribose transport system permease protein
MSVRGVEVKRGEVKFDNRLQSLLRRREPILVLFLILVAIGLQIATNFIFLNPNNLLIMIDRKVPEAFVTVGITYLLITRDFDLSVASVMALSGMVCAWLLTNEVGLIAAILLGITAGAVIGFLNGLLVTKFKVASFIATLGTMYIARSMTQIIAQGKPISGLPQEFIAIGDYQIFGLPWYFLVMIVVVIILQILLKKQKTMAKLFYVGTNEKAAQMVGINTEKLRWALFVVSAAIAAIAGLILTAKSYSASPIAFEKMELRYIAAAVIGGASISGGQGSIVGAILGFTLIVLIGNAMTLIGISPYWEGVIFGTVLAIAAIGDAISQKKKSG